MGKMIPGAFVLAQGSMGRRSVRELHAAVDRMAGWRRVLVVTGGSSGLGWETLAQLLRKTDEPWRIVMGVRDGPRRAAVKQSLLDQAKGRDVAVELYPLDLASFSSTRAFAEHVRETTPVVHDILLCAALVKSRWQETEDGLETTLQVNVVSQHLLFTALRPLLLKGAEELVQQGTRRARLVVVNSELHRTPDKFAITPHNMMHKFDATGFNGMTAYRASKHLQMSLFLKEQRSLEMVTSFIVSPGFVPTTALSRESGVLGRLAMSHVMPWMPFATSIEQGGETITKALLDLPDLDSGQYFTQKAGFLRASEECYDEAVASEYTAWVESIIPNSG